MTYRRFVLPPLAVPLPNPSRGFIAADSTFGAFLNVTPDCRSGGRLMFFASEQVTDCDGSAAIASSSNDGPSSDDHQEMITELPKVEPC